MQKITLSIAALATVFAAVPALATRQDGKTASIRLDDLDLSKPGDVRLLDRRIAGAKEAVCGSYAGARDGVEDRITECRADIDHQLAPRLAALRAEGRMASR
ncbi:UrcA family protein [Sphingomonas sp. LB-2]|uniref:UrcA family protein n=1 Tax=Sphingomonas caeni TaxID=2984949 RepID=UPI002232AD91|nr:UrcA family protein [Sphingomonas caeni]MCW3847181.1 UrcA family protein [Sphingomonas caeni]